MIVLGADTHKRSHTIAAVAAASGEVRGELTVAVGRRGFDALLRWARSLDGERVWALEDCRHVSGTFERFLLVRGERVVRVAARLTASERRTGRDRGKSDLIDALAVARAHSSGALGIDEPDPHRRGRALRLVERTEDRPDKRAPVADRLDADLDLAVAREPVERILNPRDRHERALRTPSRRNAHLVALETRAPCSDDPSASGWSSR
jgi:transposase